MKHEHAKETSGPLDEAIRVKSFADFASTYGGLDARSLLGYSLTHFFDNGGLS